MGSSKIQGELWGKAPRDWAMLQEPMHTPLFEAMLNAMNVGQGTRLLDAGCGGGGASVLAAERGAQVSGLDAAEPLLNIARERVPYGDFRVGDIEELPYEDDSFDAIIAANSLQYSADRVATLREFRRVCASCGRVSVGLWSTPDTVEYRAIFKAVKDALPEPLPGKGPFELSELGILQGLIEQVGLKVLDTGEAACPFKYPNFETLWQANSSAGPLQGALRSVSEEELKEAIRNAAKPYQNGDGSIRFENRFRYVVATC